MTRPVPTLESWPLGSGEVQNDRCFNKDAAPGVRGFQRRKPHPGDADGLSGAVLPRTGGGRQARCIGDVRRSGKYTPIVKDVLNFPYGEIRSIIIKVQHNCTSDRKRYGKMEDVPSFLPDIDQNEWRFQGESGDCCSFSPPAVLPEDA